MKKVMSTIFLALFLAVMAITPVFASPSAGGGDMGSPSSTEGTEVGEEFSAGGANMGYAPPTRGGGGGSVLG